ncbi:rod shape-determining protein MreC [Paenibacillus xylaniclasticus]|uniref:rod shape-determining protein MreC n=1 Tax=Paenibacillus xylaniclasticus TaxID=588083 RepID=UPI000FDBA4F7|nr:MULTISPECIES: rod shape-determining protein MreC [Paenibacillus]GFN33630.1 cell shape-determining protein MreC [Paenibacillus curdlanolyticus]
MIELFNLMRNKRLFVLMIGLILFIAALGFSLRDRQLSAPEKFVNDSVAYVQQWFYKPAGYIAGLFEDIGNIRSLQKENEQLRTTAAAYARDKIKYNIIEKRVEDLENKLKFTERQRSLNNYEYLIAQVISVSPDPYNSTIKIDLGSENGIKENMAVVSDDGLVGIVTKVSAFSSNVEPITSLDEKSPNSKSISVTVLGRENESFGIIGTFDHNKGRFVMNRIPENDPMIVGDTVITSGLGRVFPRGLVVGTVETTPQADDFGLTKVASVKPLADFNRLTEVFVVKMAETGEETP